jgi:iron complex outermembrane recepter protein
MSEVSTQIDLTATARPCPVRYQKPLSYLITFLMVAGLQLGNKALAQNQDVAQASQALKKLSIEELMNIEVTSVSKAPEKLTQAASAIQVITQDDILRSGATSIPEALRLAPNLQVAQLNSHHWIISARGFNSTFANKLLVMIDGRTVYSPLFAGVFWDAQNVLLADVDRIEIISGPGGTLWGANAVNGIINIITKRAKDTGGLYVSASVGSVLKDLMEARYGGTIGPKFSYRIYGLHADRDHTFLPDGTDHTDKWRLSQGGFHLDWQASQSGTLTLQGDFYTGSERDTQYTIDGQNTLARWNYTFSDKSDMMVQVYFDRTWRDDKAGTIKDELKTFDIDFHHRFPLGGRHSILWGLGFRLMQDKTKNSSIFVGFLPADRDMNLFSSFIQDEISLMPGLLELAIGTKLQHNDFSGFELQPSARFTLTPAEMHAIWTAVSRAVRAPSRIDVDYHIPAYHVPPGQPSVDGGPNFDSEKVIAYELGYRVQPATDLSLSLATFYNRYDDLYSVEALPGTQTYQIQNGVIGTSYGIEFNGNYQLAERWRLRGGYTYFVKELENKPGNVTDRSALANLGSDAKNQFLLQSILDLPGNFQVDVIVRYTDVLPATQFNPEVKSYIALDARLAWESRRFLISVNGQNVLQDRHAEFAGIHIPRNIYGKIVWRL